LANELRLLPKGAVVVALGGIAHRAIIKAMGLRQVEYKFGHAALHELSDFQVLDSYHCSRAMFDAIFAQARELLDK
jgi:uracil-DNA glycosylase